jgi:hypothetical protein
MNVNNILSTILIIIFLFLLIFFKNVDEDNEIEIYQLNRHQFTSFILGKLACLHELLR